MATGDQDDMVSRLRAALPSTWFPDGTNSPVLDGLLAGVAACWSTVYALLAYVQAQARMATATGVWLDMIAGDFFASFLVRRANELDASLLKRIKRELFRPKGTRAALTLALTDLTGKAPIIFEPRNTGDTGGYSVGGFPFGGRVYFTARNTVATYIDATGTMQTAAAGVVRPLISGGVVVGAMNEAAGTNQIANSLGATYSAQPRYTSVISSDISPLLQGALIRKVTDVTGTGDNNAMSEVDFTFAANAPYTTSLWVWVPSAFAGASIGFAYVADINIPINADLTKRNQWQRISVTETLIAGGTSGFVLRPGTLLNDYFYWTCPQFEAGSSASSYVSTSTGPATRAADNITSSAQPGGGMAYSVAGGYGNLSLPFQFFVTAYRPTGHGLANVMGYYNGSGWAGGGYGVGAIEYASLDMVASAVPDAEILAVINDVRPVATTAWTRIGGPANTAALDVFVLDNNVLG